MSAQPSTTDTVQRNAGGDSAKSRIHPQPVAVLFARADSVYKTLDGCDVYDEARDARTYDGPWPVVAHPPCRAWGNFAMFAKPRPDERNLARLAVALVREFGGVLEHPAGSKLWDAQRLPAIGQRDAWGGHTLVIDQHWWGHRAQKRTRLYIVGCSGADLPEFPLKLGRAEFVVGDVGRATSGDDRPEISKAEREHTPPPVGGVAGRARPALRKNENRTAGRGE